MKTSIDVVTEDIEGGWSVFYFGISGGTEGEKKEEYIEGIKELISKRKGN